MTTFEQFYASTAQQPLLLWCAAAVGLAIVIARRATSRSTRAFCILFGLVPLLDAWLTADRVMGIGPLGPTVAVVVATTFVIVGDFRFFLFLAAATEEGEIAIDGPRLGRALGLSLVVPIVTALVRNLLPDAPWRAQATFLIYEVMFLALVIALRARGWGATRLAWGRRVTLYVLGYYALWALADVLILAFHADAGYLLRVVPNVLYYGGLLAVVSGTSSPLVPLAPPSPRR
jgi:hypothetical protein